MERSTSSSSMVTRSGCANVATRIARQPSSGRAEVGLGHFISERRDMTKLKVLDDLYQQHVNGELTYDEWTSRVAEALRAAEDRKIKGTAGTHRLGDVADESRGAHRRKSDLLTVVADAPQAEDIREVLMFRTTSKHWDPESFVAAFDGHMLADVYFARLIKKSIVSTEFVLVDLPYHYPDRDPYIESSDFSITIPGLSERVDVGVGKMYLETAIELSPNYNSIEFDRGSTWADAYDKSKRVEWFIGRVLAPEESEVMKAREREAEEARIHEKVETFYTRDLHSLHVIKGNQMAGSVVEAAVNKRGLIEFVWM